MISPAELHFLYGDAYDDVDTATGLELWFLNFAHADLTTDATIFFALTILLGVVAMFWGDLVSWIWSVAMSLASPILAVATTSSSFIMQLAHARSRQELDSIVQRLFQDRIKKPIVDCRATHLVSAGLSWYFPAGNPAHMALRQAVTLFSGMMAYVIVLRPVAQWIIGIADVLRAEKRGLSYYCEGVRQGWTKGRHLLPQRFRGSHCSGEETGLWLRVTFEDVLRSVPRLIDLDVEIPHFRILAHAIAGIWIVIIVALLIGTLVRIYVPQRARKQPTSSGKRTENIVVEGKRASKSPVDNSSQEEVFILIRRYEGILAEKDQLLSATRQKLDAAEQHTKDGLAQFQQLTATHAKCAEKPALVSRESTDMAALRRLLAENEAQITLAQMRARWAKDEAVAREQALRNRAIKLERLLLAERECQAENKLLVRIESLQDEPQARNDQLIAMEQRSVTAEKALDAERRRSEGRIHKLHANVQILAAKNEEFQTRNGQLVDIEQRLGVVVKELATERQQYAERIHKLDAQVQDLTVKNGELRTRNDQLVASEQRLAATDKELEDERHWFTSRTNELSIQVQDLTAKNEELQTRVVATEQRLTTTHEEFDAGRLQSTHEVSEPNAHIQELTAKIEGFQTQNELALVTEQGLTVTHEELDAERRQSADKIHELDAHIRNLTARNEELQASHDHLSQMCSSLATVRRERDDALQEIFNLRNELMSTQATADTAFLEFETSLTEARALETELRQSIEDLHHSSNSALAQERAAAASAQTRIAELEVQVADLQTQMSIAMLEADGAQQRAAATVNPDPQTAELKAEIADLQTQRSLAMRDAERAQKRTEEAEKTITILETRLLRHEYAARGSLQEYPKRQMGDVGSISTALAESEVKVVQQQNQINDLQRQVEELTKSASASGSSDTAAAETQKLRVALDKVRRERTDDQVRWNKRTRELEEDNRKLRVSLSNAEATSSRRAGGGHRPGLR